MIKKYIYISREKIKVLYLPCGNGDVIMLIVTIILILLLLLLLFIFYYYYF